MSIGESGPSPREMGVEQTKNNEKSGRDGAIKETLRRLKGQEGSIFISPYGPDPQPVIEAEEGRQEELLRQELESLQPGFSIIVRKKHHGNFGTPVQIRKHNGPDSFVTI
jgi:hypothetical protein